MEDPMILFALDTFFVIAAIFLCALKEQKAKKHLFYFFKEWDVEFLFFGTPGVERVAPA
jgi:hypothetical protein